MNEKSIDLGQCIIDCKNDESCEESCVTLFKEQYDLCPCQVRRSKISMCSDNLNFNDENIFQDDCPLGCPCNSFDCQPDKKSVLVLNTWQTSTPKPVLIKFDGELICK